jgi:hypothetical protein
MTEPTASRPWPPHVAPALDRWRQGHILDAAALVSVGPDGGDDPLWAAGARTALAVSGLPVLAEDPPALRRAMVLSQGCDLVKTAFPSATVAPVYDAAAVLTPQQQETARAGLTWHLVHITAAWAAGGLWVADLRMETSVDKTLLAVTEPVEAFGDETGYGRLAERLAAIRQRPAVPDPTLDHVLNPLRAHLADQRAAGAQPLAGIRELRVQSDDPVAPTVVTLFVLADDLAAVDGAAWNEAFDVVHAHAADRGITVAGIDVTTLWDMSAADYLTSAAVSDADSS